MQLNPNIPASKYKPKKHTKKDTSGKLQPGRTTKAPTLTITMLLLHKFPPNSSKHPPSHDPKPTSQQYKSTSHADEDQKVDEKPDGKADPSSSLPPGSREESEEDSLREFLQPLARGSYALPSASPSHPSQSLQTHSACPKTKTK